MPSEPGLDKNRLKVARSEDIRHETNEAGFEIRILEDGSDFVISKGEKNRRVSDLRQTLRDIFENSALTTSLGVTQSELRDAICVKLREMDDLVNPSLQESIPCIVCGYPLHSRQGVIDHFGKQTDLEHSKFSPTEEMGSRELSIALESTIKQDNGVKNITFLDMLLAQTDDTQFNIYLSAKSSRGKSYIALELKQYFPKNEVLTYAGASPTAFYHDYGALVMEDNGDYIPIDDTELPKLKEEHAVLKASGKRMTGDVASRKREIESRIGEIISSSKQLVDLKKKILIFLDQPDSKLLERMRAVFSHDQEYVEFPITNKNTTGTNRTEHIVIRGYPSVVFCTASSLMNEQESTRNFILSPSGEPTKVEEALKLMDARMSDKTSFKKWLDEDTERRKLFFRVQLIRLSGIRNFTIERGMVYKRYVSHKGRLAPRDTRDFSRVYSLVYGYALLNCFSRATVEDGAIGASESDLDNAFHDYDEISKSNELGISPEVLDFYERIIMPAYVPNSEGLSKRNINARYFEVYGRYVDNRTLEREYIPVMMQAGLLDKVKDPLDRRNFLYVPSGNISALMVGKEQDRRTEGEDVGSSDSESAEDSLPTTPADISPPIPDSTLIKSN